MRKITPLSFQFKYTPASDSEARISRAYGRIFSQARQNIIKRHQEEKQSIDNNSTQKYTKVRYG